MKVQIAVLALASVALADVAPSYNAPSYKAPAYDYPDVAPLYNYNYNVYNDGQGYDHQNFRQEENRDGYQTHGEYSVLLPDGRTQRVVYRVDGDSGFIADVTYEGEAKYDAYKPAPKPTYAPAKPVYKPAPKPVVAYKPAPPPAPVYKPAPVPVYKPAPPPTPAYVPAPAKDYGPVRFNPFG